jgi:hypothetical protein
MRARVSILLLVSSLIVSTALAKPGSENDADKIKKDVHGAKPPELPAKAAEAVSKAKGSDKNDVAEIVINAVAEQHPASLPPVVASVAAAVPAAAATAASEAAKAQPSQAASIVAAATQAAPAFAAEILQAVVAKVPSAAAALAPTAPAAATAPVSAPVDDSSFNGNPPTKTPPENRPTTSPGNSNGNRPSTPPGLVRDPKPGRDDQHRYGRP